MEDDTSTVDDKQVPLFGVRLEENPCLPFVLSSRGGRGDVPHLGDEGVFREDRGREATCDGFEGARVRASVGLEDCVGRVTESAETVEDRAL